MISNHLGAFFDGAAGKLLSAVEVGRHRSNQHEFNGVGLLVELLGYPGLDKVRLRTRFLYVTDELEVTASEGQLTWYDARARHPTRTEYRLYYASNAVMEMAAPGDYPRFGSPRRVAREAVVIIAPAWSSVAAQLQVLFGLDESDRLDIETAPDDRPLDFTARELLEALGYEAACIQESRLEEMWSEVRRGVPVDRRVLDVLGVDGAERRRTRGPR